MKRLLALFFSIMLFSAPSFSQKKDSYRVRTVVIDPGHGGGKPGARGGRTLEKHITLSVAKKFGKLIKDNYPDVRVIYTRTTDVDVSLAERAHIANRNKADLFVSIHANSHPTAAPSGVETFVMGLSESRANLEVAKAENSDILLESDYRKNAAYDGFDPNSPETYVLLTMYQNAFIDKSLNFAQAVQNQYKQNIKTINRGVKQAELFVLYKTAMPAVLTEVGFISNPAEEDFMISDEGQAQIAVSLFNAFMTYKATEEGGSIISDPKIDLPGYQRAQPQKPREVAQTPRRVDPLEQELRNATTLTESLAEERSAEPEESMPTVVDPRRDIPVAEAVVPEAVEPVRTPAPVTPRPTPRPELTAPAQPKPVPQAERPAATAEGEYYYAVQFLTSDQLLTAGARELAGVTDVEQYHNGKFYCYLTGHYATSQEAAVRCRQVSQGTPFADAWVVKRKTTDPPTTPLAGAPRRAVPEERPAVAKAETVTRPVAPAAPETPARPKNAKALAAPRNTAPAGATTYYAVQILTSLNPLGEGAPEFMGVRNAECYRSGRYYCYTLGRFATSQDASRYCAEVQANSPFADAWVVKHKPSPETAQPAPSTPAKPAQAKPAPQAAASRTPAPAGMVYRVQFCTVPRQLKAGDPDLNGITDFHSTRSGKYFIYTCGNYATREEAEARCATLQKTTPFKDAIVVAVKK